MNTVKKIISILIIMLMIFAMAGCQTTDDNVPETPEVPEVPEEPTGEKSEMNADVIVVGAGGAGMSAALEAAQSGSSVIVLEKLGIIGGNAIGAASYNAADYDLQKNYELHESERAEIERFIELEPENDLMKEWQLQLKNEFDEYNKNGSTYLFDSPSLHKIQTYVAGNYLGKPELVDTLCENALENLKWLEGLGANWTNQISAIIGATWPRTHTPTLDWGMAGSSFVLPQAKKFEELGGELFLGYKAEELILDGERVIGVRGSTDKGEAFEIKANKGVILASGGFAANVEMRQKYNKHWANLDSSIGTTNMPGATGDGITMAESVGANLVGMEWIQLVVGSRITPSITNSIYVNTEGNRVVKEDGRRDEICNAILSQPGSYVYAIYDSHTVQDLLGGKAYDGKDIESMIDGKEYVKGETVEELAKNLDIPADTLQATIDKFNDAVDNGNDEFGRSVFQYRLDKGPFYAVYQTPNVHHTMGGVEINEKAEVLGTNGNVIDGLYACGEVAGGLHGTNRIGGNAIADIVTFGRIAGKSAAQK